ncbi:hypothetical protein DL762_006350 [Monosporascus cannonballus]|uniref:Uncharacterized protein n=1 Tax=Monosporascus cannonballus TaxID=155416 RepID=A0ABY0H2T4_9PEZI|nr:hypothetical protein DL762_006350 [Monosporascus cannonballus]
MSTTACSGKVEELVEAGRSRDILATALGPAVNRDQILGVCWRGFITSGMGYRGAGTGLRKASFSNAAW